MEREKVNGGNSSRKRNSNVLNSQRITKGRRHFRGSVESSWRLPRKEREREREEMEGEGASE